MHCLVPVTAFYSCITHFNSRNSNSDCSLQSAKKSTNCRVSKRIRKKILSTILVKLVSPESSGKNWRKVPLVRLAAFDSSLLNRIRSYKSRFRNRQVRLRRVDSTHRPKLCDSISDVAKRTKTREKKKKKNCKQECTLCLLHLGKNHKF